MKRLRGGGAGGGGGEGGGGALGRVDVHRIDRTPR